MKYRGEEMRRKLYLICSLFCMGLVAGGCAKKPEKVVKEYLKLTFPGSNTRNSRKAYQLLSSDDKKYKSEQDYIRETKKKNILNDNVLKKYKDLFRYEILETRKKGDTTLIRVKLTKPSADDILHEMVGFAMMTAISNKNDQEKNSAMEKKLSELLRSDEIETITEEKEFIVLRENKDYRLYLNLGLPVKLQRLREDLDIMSIRAEEAFRRTDLENALRIYRTMQNMQYSDDVQKRIADLELIRKHTVMPGEKLKIGKLEFSPLSIEKRKITFDKINWHGGLPGRMVSEEEYLVLTYEVRNISEEQVFSHEEENRYKKKHLVYDNYGNTMSEFALTYDMECVEGNHYKKMSPGESRICRAVCETPLSGKSEKFLWQVKLITDNKNTSAFAYVRFTRDDIKTEGHIMAGNNVK